MNDRFKFRAWNIIVERFQYFDFKELSKMDIRIFDGQILKFQQCTGLKDKNGKLIYEGDIIQFYDDEFLQTMKIVWDNDELDFKAIGLKKKC